MKAGPNAFEGNVILLVQHLLTDAPALVRAFGRSGIMPNDVFVIGIPYSTKARIVQRLRNRHHTVAAPNPVSMEKDVEDTLNEALRRCQQSGRRLVIVEDGGYCVPLASESPLAHLVELGVEQTTAGLRRDQKVKLGFPVVAVPLCELKRDFEPPVIADAVRKSLERVLANLQRGLGDCKVAVLGYGSLGSRVAAELRSLTKAVYVWDEDPIRRAVATRERFEVPSSKLDVLRSSHVVVGATGFTTMEWRDLCEVQNDACLVSASSRQVEIDVKALESHSTTQRRIKGVGTQYEFVGGRRLTLVADGYPVNFFHSDSALNPHMDVVLALLFQSALYAKGKKKKGIIRLPKSWEQEIALAYLDALPG